MHPVFGYTSTRMLLAALTSLFITLFLGPWFIKKLYEMKIGHSVSRLADVPILADYHAKKNETPTMGGVLILFAIIVSSLLWTDLSSPSALIMLITTVYFGLLGAVDDYCKLKKKKMQGLSSKVKFLLQVIFVIVFGIYFLFQEGPLDYFVPFYKYPLFVAGGILALLITIVVVVGSSNAVNLTDGLDGLASGCVVFTTLVLATFAFLSGNKEVSRYLNILALPGSGEIAIFLSGVLGATLGFLWYNGYPAQVFMGDTGSLALGAILGVSSVLLRREAVLALAGGIFVVEALSVILQVGSYKLRNKKRIFLCAPLHHHFEYKGWPESKVVVRFWLISLILALLALASVKFQ